MKKNNFIFVIFLILAMLVVPIFTFVSCDNGTTPQGPENPDTPPVDTDGEDDKEDDKTQDEEKDEVINHLVGEWIMDELFVSCLIYEDLSFKTTLKDDDEDIILEGSYVLGKDGKSATATVNNVPTGNGETITATVTMKMLEGESDVFSMDLTAFNLGDACTFVKKQSTTPNFVGTWSNKWWDILIDGTNYAVIGREPVGEYAGVTTSKGEIRIYANTIELIQNDEFGSIATGVMSTNGKSYVNYYHQTSSAPGTWKSDVFTRTSTEIPEIEIENTGNQEQSWNSTFFIGDWLQNTHETTITINDNGTFSLVSSIDSFNGLTGTYENYIEDDSSRCSRVSFNELDGGPYILTMIEEDVFEIALPDDMGGTCVFVKKRTGNIDVKGRWECESFNYSIEMQDSTFTIYIGDTENILMAGECTLSGNSYVLPGTYTTKGVVSLSNKAYVYVSGMGEYIYTKVTE